MGRHSAPDDDEVDAATDTAQGAVAVGEDTSSSAPGGRHSSADPYEPDPDEPDPDEPDDPSAGHGGLDLIDEVLADPDSGPMPVAAAPRRPAPGQPDTPEQPAGDQSVALHDAPTERIPAIGRTPEPAEERTDRIPTVAGAADADAGELPWTGAAAEDTAELGVSEVGLDSAGPVVATADPSTSAPPATASSPRRGTVGDFGLIRRHADVRARVIAAVVVPFIVFFAVFAVTGELAARSLIWIWVPAITAGVLVGLLLDSGHRRYPDAAPTAATAPADPSPGPRTR